jgi:phage shock protein A
MSIFSRVSDIIAANLNALLDRAEHPEAMLAQVIREMEDGVSQARRSAAVAVAAERRLRREWDEHRSGVEIWTARARDALAAGREDLACRALGRKQEHGAVARSLEEQHIEAARLAESARTALHALEARLAEARRRQRTLVARHRTAQVHVAVHRHLDAGRADFGASLARFDRLEDRLSRSVDELCAEADLHDPAGLEAEFTDLERERTIERELVALKGEALEPPR